MMQTKNIFNKSKLFKLLFVEIWIRIENNKNQSEILLILKPRSHYAFLNDTKTYGTLRFFNLNGSLEKRDSPNFNSVRKWASNMYCSKMFTGAFRTVPKSFPVYCKHLSKFFTEWNNMVNKFVDNIYIYIYKRRDKTAHSTHSFLTNWKFSNVSSNLSIYSFLNYLYLKI